jgi:hypothetical protein
MCPEPALLVAYLDKTLFHRDAGAVEEHIATCANCTELLDAIRARRAEEDLSRRKRRWMRAAIAVAIVAAIALVLWARWPSSNATESREVASTNRQAASAARPTTGTSATSSAAEPAKTPAPTEALPSADAEKKTAESPRAAAAAKAETRVEAAAAPAPVDAGGLVLRGRNRNRRIMWRARDRTIEHSTDGGVTWTTEHTADRSIRAGAFVDANVAWLVGESGLVLRRTKNGWFSASAPADGSITAVRASSPSKASVTLEDGRTFTTDNGGVTWSPQ